MTSIPILSVSNLTCIKGGRLLFQDLSFQLFTSEVLVLKGPNGSGKTTLLRCLAGIPEGLPEITKEKSITQSYVGHLNALKSHQTVRENLIYQPKAPLEELTTILSERGLMPLLDRKISSLSAGQKRQIALCRLLLSKAMLWLVDEPTTHLDEQAADFFWASLEAHIAAGGSVILSSHTPVPLRQAKVITLHV